MIVTFYFPIQSILAEQLAATARARRYCSRPQDRSEMVPTPR